MTKYAILGGGGSFGLHTAKYLTQQSGVGEVLGIGRNPLRLGAFSIGMEKVSNFRYRPFHITHELDLLMEYLDKEQPEVIVNFAAQGEGAVSWKHSWRFFETNSMALARLVEELEKRDYLRQFIQIGTSEMYGSVEAPASETAPIQPSSPYAASKVAFDMFLESFAKFKGFRMNIIRPSNAYCSGQLLHRIIPKVFWAHFNDIKFQLHGGGKAEKSYIHATDLARAIHIVSLGDKYGEIYNVAPEKPTAIRDVVRMTAECMGLALEDVCEVGPDRLGQDARYWLASSKIREAFGWKPLISWNDGLTEVRDWAFAYQDEIKNTSSDYVLRS